jgi:hypothetical protein
MCADLNNCIKCNHKCDWITPLRGLGGCAKI